MRKLIPLVLTALLALPALAVAGNPPSASDHAAAVKQCVAERTAMGTQPFKLLYGTNANHANAFGKCVSKLAAQNAQNRANASRQCRAERSADPAGFKAKWGTNANKSNAFGKCVAATAKAAAAQQQHATVNAAKACNSERKADPAAFKAKYGTNANKSNAFGKCVSAQVKHQPSP